MLITTSPPLDDLPPAPPPPPPAAPPSGSGAPRHRPPVVLALIAFASATTLLLVLVGADASGRLDLSGEAAQQFGVVATTTFVIAGVAASYRAFNLRSLGAAAIAGLLLGPGVVWSWITFVEAGATSTFSSGAVTVGAATLAASLLVRGIGRRRWLEVFGGLGALVLALTAGLVRIHPETAATTPAALLAAVAAMVCLYGLLVDLEVAEHRSATELIATRRQIEAEVERVEDLLHDLRSGLLAIETVIGSVDDDIAAPLQAEAARLRQLTVSGVRTVGRFGILDALDDLFATRRAAGTVVLVAGGEGATVWGERSEVVAIVENLVSNAIRHGAGGAVAVAIVPGSDTTTVAVTNRGLLPGEVADGLFRRGTTTHPDGRGLGLARCRMLAAVNGADLRLAPTDGDHTTFVLTLRSRPPSEVP